MESPFYIVFNSQLCENSSCHRHLFPTQEATRQTDHMPPPLLPLEPILSAVVRVSCECDRNSTVANPINCRARSLSIDEKKRHAETLFLWPETSSSSNLGEMSASLSTVGDSDTFKVQTGSMKEDHLTLDDGLLRNVVSGSLWLSPYTTEKNGKTITTVDGKTIDMEKIQAGVRELYRLLQQRHNMGTGSNRTAVRPNRLRNSGRTREEEEAKHMLRIIASVTQKFSSNIVFDSKNESFLVGLYCRERQHSTEYKGLSVRPIVASDLIQSFDGREGLIQSEAVDDEEFLSSVKNVMLLEVEFTKDDIEGGNLSPVWQTFFSIVDVVFVSDPAASVSRIASMINRVYNFSIERAGASISGSEARIQHLSGDCTAQKTVCPSLFYIADKEEVAAAVHYYPGKLHHVSSLQAMFGKILLLHEPSCCKNVSQWLLLLEHMWFTVSKASGTTPPISPMGKRIRNSIEMAVEVFTATAEGILLAVRAMEPLPPLWLRDGNITTVAAMPRRFVVDDVLQIARRVGCLACETVAAGCGCIFTRQLTPRHMVLHDEYCGCRYRVALQELNETYEVAAQKVKERLYRYALHCATQALSHATVTMVPWMEKSREGCDTGAISLTWIIERCNESISQFLNTPLISHYGVVCDDNISNNTTVTTTVCTKDKNIRAWSVGDNCYTHNCQIVESPIVSLWAPAAKAIALTNYVQEYIFPFLLREAQKKEVVLSTQNATKKAAREDASIMGDRCAQLQQHLKEAKAKLKHQQALLRESTRRDNKLSVRLSELCKCLQRTISTCVGYEETHSSYMYKLGFRMKHSGCTHGVPSSLREGVEEQFPSHHDKDDNDALVTTPPKCDAAVVNHEVSFDGTSSLPSISSARDSVLQVMLRDAHKQLEACHNVVLYLYENAYEALQQQEQQQTNSIECSKRNSLDNSRQSSHTVSQRTSHAETHGSHPSQYVNVSLGEVVGKETSLTALAGADAASNSSSLDVSCLTHVPQSLSPLLEKTPLPQCRIVSRISHSPPNSSSWLALAASPMHSPGGNTCAAADAIADLQEQRQEAAQIVAQLQERCAALETQLEEQRIELRDMRCRYDLEKWQWCSERETLHGYLDAGAHELRIAHDEAVQYQQEIEHWASMWSEMMSATREETQQALGEENTFVWKNGNTHNKHGDDTPPISLIDPAEAIRIARAEFRELMGHVAEKARASGAKAAKQSAEEKSTVVLKRQEEESVKLHIEIAELQETLHQMKATALETELWNRKRSVAMFLLTEERERMLLEIEQLQGALFLAMECGKQLQRGCGRLELQTQIILRQPHQIENMYVIFFNVYEYAITQRCEFLFQYWFKTTSHFTDENRDIRIASAQLKEEVQKWKDLLHQQTELTRKTAEEVVHMAGQLEHYRDAHAAANKQVELLHQRLSLLSTAYVAAFDMWDCVLSHRCALLIQQWSLMSWLREHREDAVLLSKRERPLASDDPFGLQHELKQKRCRIASLEETLRQKQILCDTLSETVTQLHALLYAQRELGMPNPPSPPRLSRDLGLLLSLKTVHNAHAASTLASAFNTSPDHLEKRATVQQEQVCHSATTEVGSPPISRVERHQFVKRDDQNGAFDNVRSLPKLGSADTTTTTTITESTEPRSLNWYLQSFSAIESILMP